MSARRGVHHSGGLRAKWKWLAWRRYQRRCEAVAGFRYPTLPGYLVGWAHAQPMLNGYVRAHARWSYVGRYAPIGIRDVRP